MARYLRCILPILVLLLAACGANPRQEALQTSLTALNTARNGFVAWDKAHQQKIVAGAATYEEGKAAIDAYRAKRAKVVQGFVVAYSALAAAALDDKTSMLIEAAIAAQELYKLIKLLTEEPPAMEPPAAEAPPEEVPEPADPAPAAEPAVPASP
jgi:hypothetical protein